jgi:beta-glucosidase
MLASTCPCQVCKFISICVTATHILLGSDSTGKNILWGGGLLQTAVSNKQISTARIDDMVKRVLASWYLTKQDSSYPNTQVVRGGSNSGNVQSNNATIARAVARDGIVLLKNTENLLPLKKPKSIAIVGSGAVPNPKGINSCQDQGCDTGTLAMGWGSGTATLPVSISNLIPALMMRLTYTKYLSSPLEAITTRAKQDSTSVTSSTSDTTSSGATAAQSADVAIVFISADSGEEYITVETNAGDRVDLNAWHSGADPYGKFCHT